MPTPTYTPLANITLGSSASSVTFSSISQAYRDLILAWNGTTSTTAYTRMQINADAGSNYSLVNAYGYSGGYGSGTVSSTSFQLSSSGTSQRQSGIMQIMDYSVTDKHKTVLLRDVQDNADSVSMVAGRWSSTSAITAISVYRASGTFETGSTFTLYGIGA